MKNRTLYFGDNLEILRKKIPDETFDLIYLDPPFNSNRSYNVLFREGLQDSPAQVKAFEDSWHWNRESKSTFDFLVRRTNENIANLMQALEKVIGQNDMMAYLAMMTVRLIELRRVLKSTGSIYLHCDPTASHYLKIVLDAIFGKKNFRNEIVWSYNKWAVSQKMFSRNHDIVLFYCKDSESLKFHTLLQPRAESTLKRFGMKKIVSAVDPKTGKRVPSQVESDESEGVKMSDVWQIPILAPVSKERLGYPTQKPEALLERIIQASSKEGDLILDPFCGCGTTVAVAERFKRHWVGIDITALAINLIKRRLKDQFELGSRQIIVDGLPTDLTGARELFKKDPFEFEYWALDLVEAVPAQSKSKENMRGADKGIDGVIFFHKNLISNGNGNGNGKWEYGKILVQVKGGGVQRRDIATLKGDVDRERADGGLFITLEKPTKPMIQETVDSGEFTTPITGKMEFPKIQILTVEELLNGKRPNLPQGLVKSYHKEAKYTEINNSNQSSLLSL
ncbi:MAG: site-specific DNA-methyltransferase [Candidatus Moranbacteria bacterium]|nr:site-specific DNA-methyltransferase [Candidatus Moranbacteria bacterium]